MPLSLAQHCFHFALRPTLVGLICAVLFIISTSSAIGQSDAAAKGVLLRVDGSQEVVELKEIRDDKLLLGGDKPRELPASEVWRFGADPASLRGAYLLLRDGSRFAAPLLRANAEAFDIPADDFQPGFGDGLRFPRAQVQAVLWKPPHGSAALAALLDVQKHVVSDALRLDNGDLVSGELRGIIETAEGEEELLFAVRQRESRIPVDRAVSLQLAHKEENAVEEAAAWTLAFADGSRVRAKELTATPEEVRWTSSAGQTHSFEASRFWKNLLLVEPPRKNVIFLSDQTPQGYRHLPLFGDPAPWGRDRSATGAPLRHRSAWFAKGIGMWSNSRLTFAIPEGAVRFQSQLCIDDAAGDGGSVRFRILSLPRNTDGGALKDLYRSEVIRGGDSAITVDLPVEGQSLVILLVESADQEDVLDLANWLDARWVMAEK